MKQKLELEFKKEKARPNTFSEELKTYMYDLACLYGYEHYSIKQIFYLLKHGYKSIPICQLDGCNEKRIFNKSGCLTKGCCAEHTRKINNLKKYGVTNVSHMQQIKDKIKNSAIEKYGVEFPMQNQQIKDKFVKTSVEKYGYSNPGKNKKIQEKIESTNLEKYGVKRPIQNEKIFKKMKKTNLLKYNTETIFGSYYFIEKSLELFGTPNPMQNITILDKTHQTNIKKYGGKSPNSSPEIFEKQQKQCYMKKEYKWKTGEISIVQGYEPQVLRDLEQQGYEYNHIITKNSEMPCFLYTFENKKSRYYPDFFIPMESLIIEVKSQYTYENQLERNLAKFQAVKDAGFNFKLIIK